jgi:hypothetical protein
VPPPFKLPNRFRINFAFARPPPPKKKEKNENDKKLKKELKAFKNKGRRKARAGCTSPLVLPLLFGLFVLAFGSSFLNFCFGVVVFLFFW